MHTVYQHMIVRNMSLEYLFGQHMLSLFSDLFSSELFLRVIDILLLEFSRKSINVNYVIISIVLTICRENEDLILKCKKMEDVQLIINCYCHFLRNFDEFIQKVYQNLINYFFNEQTNYFEI